MSEWLLSLLVGSSAKSALVLAGAALLALLLRRGSAAWRHLAWTVAVTGALCLPVISALLPDWRVLLVLPWPRAAMPVATQTEPLGALTLIAQTTDDPFAASARQPSFNVVSNLPAQPAVERSEAHVTVRKPAAASTKLWALGVWSIGSLLSGVPVLLGMLSLRKVAQGSSPVTDEAMLRLIRQLTARIGLTRSVRLDDARKRRRSLLEDLKRVDKELGELSAISGERP